MEDESGSMTFSYDSRGRLTGKTSIINGIIYDISRSHTPGGRVSSITYPTGRTIDYNRPVCACRVDSIATSYEGTTKTLMENLTYRPFGVANGMDTGAGGIVSSEYDESGRVITDTDTVTYTYDLNGNITGIGDMVLTYNQNNRLVMVEEDSVTLGEYTYNGLGQRIIKEADGVTTIFLYDFDGNIIAESDESGNFDKEYLYRSSSRLALVDVGTGELYYYGNDRLGMPQILTDLTNTVVWEAVYDPFGEADINPNSSVVSNFRFPGQYFDSETGLHYNYHRYYDPATGRYITPDPIALEGGINIYDYVLNNPVNLGDSFGLELIGSQKRNLDGTTTYYFYDIDTGAEYIYQGLTEPAPIVSPITGCPYGLDAKLPPGDYLLVPRPDPGTDDVTIKKGWPVYTTVGQEPGVVKDPCENTRAWIGPHLGTKSKGCPLFPITPEGKKQHNSLIFLIQYYEKFGGTAITVH